jgi:GTP-binding protein Era
MKVGYCAIAGRPNAGKSTLLNAFLGVKLAAVSRRPQTTRAKVLGVDSGPEHQIVFLDTPGLLEPRYLMQRNLLKIAQSSIREADVQLYLIDAGKGFKEEDPGFLAKQNRKKTIIVLNKMDLVTKERLLPLIAEVSGKTGIDEIYPVSALRKFGLDMLRQGIIAKLPEGKPFYDPETLTDQPEKFFVAEIVREKLFELCGAEVPYATAVVIDTFREQEGRKDLIQATVWVERPSQKMIVIGQGGRKIKAVGTAARRGIEEFLGRPVFLELFVKVKGKWREREGDLRELGL